jgi:hypothetical protein
MIKLIVKVCVNNFRNNIECYYSWEYLLNITLEVFSAIFNEIKYENPAFIYLLNIFLHIHLKLRLNIFILFRSFLVNFLSFFIF